MNVHEVKSIETKSILSRLKSKDNYWGIAYNMNLYRGCQHGCIYCDTRSSCYGVGDISHISVKKNALELLDHELGTKRGKATIGTGSMNDPYMPLEKQMKLTGGALEIIAKHRFPVHVITKSSLVTRDADVLQDIGALMLPLVLLSLQRMTRWRANWSLMHRYLPSVLRR